jgi:hypothetical protein
MGRRALSARVRDLGGGKPAAHLISLVTQAICDVLQPQFPDCDVSVYLDDFHIVGSTIERVWEVVRALRGILSALGIEEAVDKFVAPSDCAISLGTQFDLRHGRVCVVPERAARRFRTSFLPPPLAAILRVSRAPYCSYRPSSPTPISGWCACGDGSPNGTFTPRLPNSLRLSAA